MASSLSGRYFGHPVVERQSSVKSGTIALLRTITPYTREPLRATCQSRPPRSPSGLSIKYSTLIPGRSAAAAPRREERENILFFLSFNIYHVYFRERLLNRGQHGDYEARYILFNMFPSPWVFCLVSVSKKVWYGVQGVGRMAFRRTSHASVFHVFSRAAHNKRRNSSRYIYCLDIYLFNYLDKNVRVVLRRVRSLSV